VVACVVLGTSVIGSVAPAEAQRADRRERERYVERYCDRNPRDRDCRDFRDHRRNWNDSRYQRWYRDRHRGNDNAAAALFGLAAGAIVGGAISSAQGNSHVQACEARFRSYDRRSDTYLAFDGQRRRCTL